MRPSSSGVYSSSRSETPKPVPQGAGELACPGRRADQREPRQLQADRIGGGALANDDIDGKILHGRVQNFLYGAVEPVNLIDKQDIPGLSNSSAVRPDHRFWRWLGQR